MEKLLFITLALIFLLLSFFKGRKWNKHKKNIRRAAEIIKKIKSFEHSGQKINYLRKIDPFVFEELLLTLFKNNGYKIKRNKRYTGDGGIDGIIYDSRNNKILIQAKRYSGYVNLKDIYEFNNLVYHSRAEKGFFIHTGKTGKESYQHFKSSNIEIISGSKLIDLFNYPKNN